MSPNEINWQRVYVPPAPRRRRPWKHVRNSVFVLILVASLVGSLSRVTYLVSKHGNKGITVFGQEVSTSTHNFASQADARANAFNSFVGRTIELAQQHMLQRDIAVARTITTSSQQTIAFATGLPSALTSSAQPPIQSKAQSSQASASHVAAQTKPGNTKLEAKPTTAVTKTSEQPIVSLAALPDYRSKSAPPVTSQITPNGAYSFGQCTYYVAGRRPVGTHWGNARDWMSHARAEGYQTGTIPVAGAVAWTPAGWYGHVAYVEQVNGEQVQISEMNFAGWNVVSRRWVPASSFQYIY